MFEYIDIIYWETLENYWTPLHTFECFLLFMDLFLSFHMLSHTFAYIWMFFHMFAHFFIILYMFAYLSILLNAFAYSCILLYSFFILIFPNFPNFLYFFYLGVAGDNLLLHIIAFDYRWLIYFHIVFGSLHIFVLTIQLCINFVLVKRDTVDLNWECAPLNWLTL